MTADQEFLKLMRITPDHIMEPIREPERAPSRKGIDRLIADIAKLATESDCEEALTAAEMIISDQHDLITHKQETIGILSQNMCGWRSRARLYRWIAMSAFTFAGLGWIAFGIRIWMGR
jgi:hypothetical protein